MLTDAIARVRATIVEDPDATPAHLIRATDLDADLAAAPPSAAAWARAIGFTGRAGAFVLTPDGAGGVGAALIGCGDRPPIDQIAATPAIAPPGSYRLATRTLERFGVDPAEAALAWALGSYRFERYRAPEENAVTLATDDAIDPAKLERALNRAAGLAFGRDLVNTPTADLGPIGLEAAARGLAEAHGASLSVIAGDALLDSGFPMIHAVGRAAAEAPRLLDLAWGPADAPRVTLVGKGVCFDTGGLDIKPPRAMRLMKKDMGGAAVALATAHMIMAERLNLRLRVLVPAVENAVDAKSFRPGDVLRSRKGLTVEIGDTDAEGRLVLADALTLADADAPDLLLDFATLTGAARVAVGPEIAPFYTDDDDLADGVWSAAQAAREPAWRMPLHRGYASDLSSSIADLSNVSTTGFAGSITAALFLSRFVSPDRAWAHFDVFCWNPKTRPGRPEGGDAHAALLAFALIEKRYGRK